MNPSSSSEKLSSLLASMPTISCFTTLDNFSGLVSLLTTAPVDLDRYDDVGRSPASAEGRYIEAVQAGTCNSREVGRRASGSLSIGACRSDGLYISGTDAVTCIGTELSQLGLSKVPGSSPPSTFDDYSIKSICNQFTNHKETDYNVTDNENINVSGDNNYFYDSFDYGDFVDESVPSAPRETQLDNLDENELFSLQLASTSARPPLMSLHRTGLATMHSDRARVVASVSPTEQRSAYPSLGIVQACTTRLVESDRPKEHDSARRLRTWLKGTYELNKRGIVIQNMTNRGCTSRAILDHIVSSLLVNSSHSISFENRTAAQSGYLLIICNKPNVDFYADIARSYLSAKLLIYTESYEKRRKYDASTLSQYHIVITTFDVLKSKEVRVYDNLDSSSARLEGGWISAHLNGGDTFEELSALHLLKWNTCIVDHGSNVTGKCETLAAIRINTLKGNAVKRLKCGSVLSLAIARVKCVVSTSTVNSRDPSDRRRRSATEESDENAGNAISSTAVDKIRGNILPLSVVKSMGSIMNITGGIVNPNICLDLSNE